MIPLPILIPLSSIGYLVFGVFTVFLITLAVGEEFFSGDDKGFEYLPFFFWPIALVILLFASFQPLMRWVITQGDIIRLKRRAKHERTSLGG